MGKTIIAIVEGFERDDNAIGNLVTTDAPGFEGQYIICGNGDPATLTLRELTILSGQGKPFRIGRSLVKVTHLSVPVECIKN